MVPYWYYDQMPPKIRKLENALKKAGFILLSGKGSHRKYVHPSGPRVTISGKTGSDAHAYQVIAVREVLKTVRNESK